MTDKALSGPYINAETTAGGITHWVTSQVAGELRTNATDFHDSWQGYINAIAKVTVPNQINKGGPIIGMSNFLAYSVGCAKFYL